MNDPVQEEIACAERGADEFNAGRFEQAIEPLEQALTLNQDRGWAGLETAVDSVELVYVLGRSLMEVGRYADSVSCLAKVLEIHQEDGDTEGQMDTLASLGHAQLKAAEASGDREAYAAAGSCFAGELELAYEVGNVEAQAEAFINGSHCFSSAADYDDETVEYLQYAIAFLEQHAEQVDADGHHLVRIRILLGLCFNERDEYARALEPLRLAEEIARSHSGCTCRLRSLRGLVDALEQLEDWAAYERYLRIAIEHCQATGNSTEPDYIGRLGAALAAQRDTAGGLREADRAVELAKAMFVADPSTESALGSALGIKTTILNNIVKRFGAAVEPAERSAEIARRHGEVGLLVNRLLVLGGVHMNIGGREGLGNAIEALEEALPLAEKLEDAPSEALAHARLGLVHLWRGESTAAIAHHESAIEIYRSIGDYSELGAVLVSLAAVPDLPPGRAVACLIEAQEISKRIVDSAAEALALRELSRVRRAVGLHEEASEALRLGLEIVESVRARLATSVERGALIETHSALYADAAYLAHKRNEPLLAFRYAEAGRGRLILDQRAEEAAGQVRDPARRERRRELAGEIGRQARQLERLGTEWLDAGRGDGVEDRDRIEAESRRVDLELRRLENEWLAMEASLAAENPRFAARVPAGIDSIWGVSEIQERLLTDDSVLLEYLIAEDGCLLFCVTGEEYEIFELDVDPDEIAAMVEELCAALGRRDGGYPHGYALYRALVKPAADLLAGKSEVLIAPSGALHQLPFGVLLSEDPGSVDADGQPFFADRWHDLPYLLDGSRHFRSIASATTEGMLREVEEADPVAYGSDLLALSAPLAPAGEERASGFPPLPSAQEEVEGVLDGLGGGGREPGSFARGDQVAKSDAVELLSDSTYRFVHFVTHGLLDDRSPWLSALVFEPEPGSISPGYLHANEAVDLPISAQCVTLSGCQTLGEAVSAGEGVLGLGLAFRYAGARAVCASRWSVADEVTTLMMRRFYENLGCNRELPSAALADTQRSLIAESYHPFYWAAFGVFS